MSDMKLIAATRTMLASDHARLECPARYSDCACGRTRHIEDFAAKLADRLEAVSTPAIPTARWLAAIEAAAQAQWGDTSDNHRIGHRIYAALMDLAEREEAA